VTATAPPAPSAPSTSTPPETVPKKAPTGGASKSTERKAVPPKAPSASAATPSKMDMPEIAVASNAPWFLCI
jgi:hypothetical protein